MEFPAQYPPFSRLAVWQHLYFQQSAESGKIAFRVRVVAPEYGARKSNHTRQMDNPAQETLG